MSYKAKFQSEEIETLFEAILKLEDIEECYKFFEDLCTIKEIQSLSQRFQVACLLEENKTYSEIEKTTGASTATISRINKCLLYGAEGYKLILERMKQDA